MYLEIFYISLTGIGVVFSFLFIIFLLLKGLKFVESDKKEEISGELEREKKVSGGAVEEEIVAAITAAIRDYTPVEGKEILITKK
ncbi:MAG: OadG family protein [Halanaerobiaceae bacterium]